MKLFGNFSPQAYAHQSHRGTGNYLGSNIINSKSKSTGHGTNAKAIVGIAAAQD